MESSSWMYRKITDYWDQKAGAVENGARRLEALPADSRAAAVRDLEGAIERQVSVLDDQAAVLAAVAMVDDLYKAATVSSYWDANLNDYLAATAARFSTLLSDRRITVNYAIDNAYELTEFGLQGPVEALPRWLRAAGFVYICPQMIAIQMMETDKVPRDQVYMQLNRYAREAVDVARELVGRCHTDRRHFVFLDADATDESLTPAISRRGQEGFLIMLRHEAPFPGTKCAVWPPKGIDFPAVS